MPLAAAQYIHAFSGIPTLLYYKTYNLGPAHDWVVFVHSPGGSSRIGFGHIRDFRRHFNVLLIDLRGLSDESQRLSFSALGARYRKKHTHATLAVIEGAGHSCNVEAPQAFNERPIAFIQAHPVADVLKGAEESEMQSAEDYST